ncbi:lipase family protein [Klebsiella michiganensis]|uniref:lipase family protein n=1 Tax=Klebsiella michiganensis TaxID=1134687 RepID=UPI003F50CDAC
MKETPDTRLARLAALVMYAWDMCSHDLHNLIPPPDARIAHDGWTVCGYLSGNDDIDGHHIRTACYGFVAHNAAGEYVVVIRGTAGTREWVDDAKFRLKVPDAPFQGKVEDGFYNIYRSMRYWPADREGDMPLAAGIAALVGTRPLTVTGHSLGAALATYLTLDLAASERCTQVALRAFASPRPGDGAFATGFAKNVGDYQVINYRHDAVPKLPLIGFTSLPDVRLLDTSAQVTIAGGKTCSHHLISYIALLDAKEFTRITALDGTTPDDQHCATCVTLHASIATAG